MDNNVHELKLGRSFDSSSRAAFHSIRYDFKPASVDTTQEATFEVGEGHQVSVTLPHVQSSGTSHTVYKGNKKPCPKECVLIIDHDTGTFTLEKLTNSIALKKTRIEGSSRMQQRPLTPVEVSKRSPSRQKMNQRSPSSMKSTSPVSSQQDMDIVQPESNDATFIGEISSSSDDSSSDDSDSDNETSAQQAPAGQANGPSSNQSASGRQFSLMNDLALSESGSDSD